MTERLETMRLELRRGVLVLAVLLVLRREHYGYSLRKILLEAGLDIEEGTLYPLVRRLESQGLLDSRWDEEDGRKRRYYKISAEGRKTLAALKSEWSALNDAVSVIQENRG